MRGGAWISTFTAGPDAAGDITSRTIDGASDGPAHAAVNATANSPIRWLIIPSPKVCRRLDDDTKAR